MRWPALSWDTFSRFCCDIWNTQSGYLIFSVEIALTCSVLRHFQQILLRYLDHPVWIFNRSHIHIFYHHFFKREPSIFCWCSDLILGWIRHQTQFYLHWRQPSLKQKTDKQSTVKINHYFAVPLDFRLHIKQPLDCIPNKQFWFPLTFYDYLLSLSLLRSHLPIYTLYI